MTASRPPDDGPWTPKGVRELACCGSPGNCARPETCEQALRANAGEAWFNGLGDDWRERNPGVPWDE